MIPPKQRERLLNREAFKGSRDLHQNDHIMRTKLKKFFDGIEDVLMILEHLPPQQVQSVISSDELRAAFDITEATIKALDIPQIDTHQADMKAIYGDESGNPEAIRRYIIVPVGGAYIGPDKVQVVKFSLRRGATAEEIAARNVAAVSIDMLKDALSPPAQQVKMDLADFIIWARETFPDYQLRFDTATGWTPPEPPEEEESTDAPPDEG